MASLDGRIVVVTGASRGIGRAFAIALARAGARVTLIASRITPALRTTEAEIIAIAGTGNVLTIPTDVRVASACERAVRAAHAEFGRIDALVNNAGLGMRHVSETSDTRPVNFWDVTAEQWDDIMSTNALGPFYMARAVVPFMLRDGGGRIVNIGTSEETLVRRGYSPYGPSKAALEAMTRIWAQDLDGTGITCNLLLPGGATDTDATPGERDGTLLPATIMNEALLWLLSDAAREVTGRRIVGRAWDASRAPDLAAAGAMAPRAGVPSIL